MLPFFAVEMMMCSADLICGSNFPSPDGGRLSTRMRRGKGCPSKVQLRTNCSAYKTELSFELS